MMGESDKQYNDLRQPPKRMEGWIGTKTTFIAVTMCISFSTSTKWFSTCMEGGILNKQHLLWSTVMLSSTDMKYGCKVCEIKE